MHYDHEGRLRGNHNAGEYAAWAPYVNALGSVILVARLHRDQVTNDGPLVTGPGVELIGVRPYAGMLGLLSRFPGLLHDFARIGSRDDVFIGRIPEPLSILAWLRAKRLRARYVSLVVADPSSLLRSSVSGVVGHLIAPIVSLVTRIILKHSSAVIYVSERWLQVRYPAAPGTSVMARSNVRLSDNDFVNGPRQWNHDPEISAVRLISIGSMSSRVKGHDVLIDALAMLRQRGVRASLSVIGDGAERARLEALASEYGVDVRFVGQIHDTQHVFRELDAADVYVTASRSEGLSRAVVESMARGLPVVATDSGAIDELIDAAYIVEVDDAAALASAIACLVLDPAKYERESARNLTRARQIVEQADPARLTSFLRDCI